MAALERFTAPSARPYKSHSRMDDRPAYSSVYPAMGHTHSRFSDRGRIDATSSPPSISHISLKVHKLHPSLTKSLPSSDEKDHSHYDSDLRPRPYIHSAAISFPVVSTPSPRRLPRRAGTTEIASVPGILNHVDHKQSPEN